MNPTFVHPADVTVDEEAPFIAPKPTTDKRELRPEDVAISPAVAIGLGGLVAGVLLVILVVTLMHVVPAPSMPKTPVFSNVPLSVDC